LAWLGVGTETLGRLEKMNAQDPREIFKPLMDALDRVISDSENDDSLLIVRDIIFNLTLLYTKLIKSNVNDFSRLDSHHFDDVMSSYAICMNKLYKSDFPTDYRVTYPLTTIFDIINAMSGDTRNFPQAS
jgi:hypothetical protein